MERTVDNTAKVPRLLELWKDHRSPNYLLEARAALVDAASALVDCAVKEERAMKADEQRQFDEFTAQVRDINVELAEYKRQRVADVVAAGLPAEYCRLPF